MALIEIDDIFPAIETSIYGWDVPVRYVSHNQTVYPIKIPLNHHKVPLNHPIIGPSALTHPHRLPSPQVPKAWRCASLLDARSSVAPPCRSTCRPRPWWEQKHGRTGRTHHVSPFFISLDDFGWEIHHENLSGNPVLLIFFNRPWMFFYAQK